LTDIHELAITPAQQLKGLGKKLMLHIIELAKKERLNIMLTAAAGSCLDI
jgi:GNAT superfamily N-acetyltransferase